MSDHENSNDDGSEHSIQAQHDMEEEINRNLNQKANEGQNIQRNPNQEQQLMPYTDLQNSMGMIAQVLSNMQRQQNQQQEQNKLLLDHFKNDDDLKNQLKLAGGKIANLTDKVNALSSKNNETDLSDIKEDMNKFKNEIYKKLNDFTTKDDLKKIEEYQEVINESKNKNYEEEISDLRKKNKELEKKVDKLQKQLDEDNVKIAEQLQEIRQYIEQQKEQEQKQNQRKEERKKQKQQQNEEQMQEQEYYANQGDYYDPKFQQYEDNQYYSKDIQQNEYETAYEVSSKDANRERLFQSALDIIKNKLGMGKNKDDASLKGCLNSLNQYFGLPPKQKAKNIKKFLKDLDIQNSNDIDKLKNIVLCWDPAQEIKRKDDLEISLKMYTYAECWYCWLSKTISTTILEQYIGLLFDSMDRPFKVKFPTQNFVALKFFFTDESQEIKFILNPETRLEEELETLQGEYEAVQAIVSTNSQQIVDRVFELPLIGLAMYWQKQQDPCYGQLGKPKMLQYCFIRSCLITNIKKCKHLSCLEHTDINEDDDIDVLNQVKAKIQERLEQQQANVDQSMGDEQ